MNRATSTSSLSRPTTSSRASDLGTSSPPSVRRRSRASGSVYPRRRRKR